MDNDLIKMRMIFVKTSKLKGDRLLEVNDVVIDSIVK